MRTVKMSFGVGTTAPAAILLVLLLACTSHGCYAQKKPERKVSVAQLANFADINIPLKTIIDNPVINTTVTGCEVTGYTISFLPKGGEFKGPYKTTGNKISENNLSYLKAFSDGGVRIFVEDIHMKCSGKDTTAATLIYKTAP